MSDTWKIAAALGAVLGVAVLFTFERPPIIGVQRGFRGTGQQEVYNPRNLARDAANNIVPASLPQLQVGPLAGTVYKNVKVLQGVHVAEFTRLMAAMTTWVAPKQGCAYCHALNNMASDSLYTKVVARRMLQMVQHINADWTSHVVGTGVTCYTCHRGNPVPVNIWYHNDGQSHFDGMAETHTGVSGPLGPNHSSLPVDPYTPYLENAENIRVQSNTALPVSDNQSIKQAEWTYALMIHFATSLGVNCAYCHNTRAFGDWSQSNPQRVTAWYGIRMVRDLNGNYLNPLHDTLPPIRWGEQGDGPKLNCATCHQGAYKPLYGVSMAADYPELRAPVPVSTVPAETPPVAPAVGPPTPPPSPSQATPGP